MIIKSMQPTFDPSRMALPHHTRRLKRGFSGVGPKRMKPQNLLILGAVAVIAFDAAASVGSLAFGFPYANASLGSFLIYFAAGFMAARIKARPFSLLVGACAGLADATLGWGVSWALGPGRLPANSYSVSQLVVAGASAVIVATVVAGVGGIVGGFFRVHSAQQGIQADGPASGGPAG